jgi:hypothetical protein
MDAEMTKMGEAIVNLELAKLAQIHAPNEAFGMSAPTIPPAAPALPGAAASSVKNKDKDKKPGTKSED